MIELINVKKNYGKTHALNGINLSVERGKILGVIGPSGAGKSTLVRVMNLLEYPNEGEVRVKGIDIMKIPKRELAMVRRKMAMIFQGFHLFHQRTVLQNVLFPLEIGGIDICTSKRTALGMLERVGLSDKLDAYPGQLSGGQKQRVAIARALAAKPEVILCDEATSALDPETTDVVLDLLRGIHRELGITIVLVTHEMDVVNRICDEVVIVDKGRVVERGSTGELFQNPQTTVAKKLVLGHANSPKELATFEGGKSIRITFDNTAFEPILANMILSSGIPVNIMYSDTKHIAGKSVGQMIIKLPKEGWETQTRYLTEKGIFFEDFDEDLNDGAVYGMG